MALQGLGAVPTIRPVAWRWRRAVGVAAVALLGGCAEVRVEPDDPFAPWGDATVGEDAPVGADAGEATGGDAGPDAGMVKPVDDLPTTADAGVATDMDLPPMDAVEPFDAGTPSWDTPEPADLGAPTTDTGPAGDDRPTPVDVGGGRCGALAEACCGAACNVPLRCTGGLCVEPPCGGAGDACCNGTACNAGLRCEAGQCTTAAPACGALGQGVLRGRRLQRGPGVPRRRLRDDAHVVVRRAGRALLRARVQQRPGVFGRALRRVDAGVRRVGAGVLRRERLQRGAPVSERAVSYGPDRHLRQPRADLLCGAVCGGGILFGRIVSRVRYDQYHLLPGKHLRRRQLLLRGLVPRVRDDQYDLLSWEQLSGG